ncbi:hypothetical protein NQ317_001589 [Molorchus minor]|uniref:Tyr recombinase domain-containing protein n=1 Tax=Molorchus minor TaxID=1323400 RepID=A0ABQ9IXW9_9CUCU|nr:hypothetical protein NQ317_001589 [Molorchus minor]
MNNCESEEIVEAANIAISNLLPTKSRSLYDIAYNRFKKWCADKNVQVYSENVSLAYFSENAKNYKSSTLWAHYSMVKTGDGYQAKNRKILTKSEIDRFLSSADDKDFLMIKVGLIILGIAGACRTDELVNLTVDDIEGCRLLVEKQLGIPGCRIMCHYQTFLLFGTLRFILLPVAYPELRSGASALTSEVNH